MSVSQDHYSSVTSKPLNTSVADPLSSVIIRASCCILFLQLLTQSDVNCRFGEQFENLVSLIDPICVSVLT